MTERRTFLLATAGVLVALLLAAPTRGAQPDGADRPADPASRARVGTPEGAGDGADLSEHAAATVAASRPATSPAEPAKGEAGADAGHSASGPQQSILQEFWYNFTHNLFKPLLLFFYMGF